MWRKWLELNYTQDKGIWVVMQKVKSPRVGVKYDEALDEALCFGWIDGKMKRLDDHEFKQWFSPRRRNSPWSKRNRDKVEKLIDEGHMMPSGLAEVEKAKENGRWEAAYSSKRIPTMSEEMLAALKSNKVAYENFTAFPDSARLMYIHWVNDAKRTETKTRRIGKVVERAMQNKKPGIDM
jgi:uncharacterized protein YdeI (YjbR/CyaY-like superfamily)